MNSLLVFLNEIFSKAFEKAGFDATLGVVGVSQRPDLSQYQCNGALPAAKKQKANPRKIAEKIIENLDNRKIFSKLTIDGPGFINISLADDFLKERISLLHSDPHSGCPVAVNPQNVLIDFAGPNIAKPMHVGHLRSAIIGDCLQRLFRFAGHSVTSDNHLGDWGTQMGMVIQEIKNRQPNLPYFDANFKGDYPSLPPVSLEELGEYYPQANARCRQDPSEMKKAQEATCELQKGNPGYRALWKQLVALSTKALKSDFERLGIRFDSWKGESHYEAFIPKLVENLKSQGLAKQSEGALVIELPPQKNGHEMPPFLLVKSDGGFLYSTTDLATLGDRVSGLRADRIVYVVDKRQSLHFHQLFAAARQTGIAGKADLVHVGFGTVNGPDGKPFKTRSGGVMKLGDLITLVTTKAYERMQESGIAEGFDPAEKANIAHKVGIATLKYADLMNHRESDYVFDLDRFSSFEGNTGPYLLYVCVRIQSILRKAEEKGLACGEILPPTDLERDLCLHLLKLPEAVELAMSDYAPNFLCDYANTLAQSFNRFYQDCHILREEDAKRQASWLTLSKLCLTVLSQILLLLGIESPDRM